MARRRKAEAPADPVGAPPAWLCRFRYSDWEDGFSPDSPNVAHEGKLPWQIPVTVEGWNRAKRRYEAAGEAWLTERGLYDWDLRQPDGGWEEFQRIRRETPWLVIDVGSR